MTEGQSDGRRKRGRLRSHWPDDLDSDHRWVLENGEAQSRRGRFGGRYLRRSKSYTDHCAMTMIILNIFFIMSHTAKRAFRVWRYIHSLYIHCAQIYENNNYSKILLKKIQMKINVCNKCMFMCLLLFKVNLK